MHAGTHTRRTVGAGVCDTCAPRFDIRYTFTIAQANRYLLAPVSLSRTERILRSTDSAHALVHTLASRWNTTSELSCISLLVSCFGARARERRTTHEKENETRTLSFFFFLFCPVCCTTELNHERSSARRALHQARRCPGIYATRDLFLSRNCTLELSVIGNCTWADSHLASNSRPCFVSSLRRRCALLIQQLVFLYQTIGFQIDLKNHFPWTELSREDKLGARTFLEERISRLTLNYFEAR